MSAGVQHVCLVTGASRGLGVTIAEAIARSGSGVLCAARTLSACESVAESIRAQGGRAWPLELDVTRPESIERAAREARELAEPIGPVDGLVNNAGLVESAPLLPKGGGEAGYQRALEVNFHGARRVAEAFLPDFLERGHGRIVNVASSAGLRGYAYVSAYCASKFALVGYTLAAAEELAKTGVTINAVCPHYVDSPMLDATIAELAEKTGKDSNELRAFFREQNPGARLVRPDEVADAVVRLLSGSENGVLLELDGSGEPRANRPGHEPRPGDPGA